MLRAALLMVAGGLGSSALAATYTLPIGTDTVVGEVQKVVAAHEDTLLDIGRKYGVGYEEIVAANPGISPWLPGAGTVDPIGPKGQLIAKDRYIVLLKSGTGDALRATNAIDAPGTGDVQMEVQGHASAR